MFDQFKIKLVTARQARLWPYFALLLCFAAVFIRFPGEWDSDTVTQNEQAMTGEYRDWHPPLFAAFWRLVNGGWNALTGMEYTGSGVLYVAHALMLWGGLALLLRAAATYWRSFVGKARRNFLAVLAFLLFFGLFELAPMTRFIFKDTAMMGAYILALGIMLNLPGGRLRRRLALCACLLLFFYGTGVRHNAAFALVPMLGLLLLKFRPGTRLRVLIPVVFLLWGGLLAGIHTVTYDVLKAKKEYLFQQVIYMDYWKINYKTRNFDPPPLPDGQPWGILEEDAFFRFYNDKSVYIRPAFDFIHAYYGSVAAAPLIYDFSHDAEGFSRLTKAWLNKIKDNLKVYLDIHKRIFVDLLREYSFMGMSGALLFVLGSLVSLAGLRLFFRKAKADPAPYLLAVSGLLYVLPYAVVTPAIERRYLFWFFFATFLSLLWLAARFAGKYGLTRKNAPAAQNNLS